jgi:hypothetical protein
MYTHMRIGDVPIGDVLGGGFTLLAWNGRSIGDTSLRPGMFGMPICIKVTLGTLSVSSFFESLFCFIL